MFGMGFENPATPWSELERRLSGRAKKPEQNPVPPTEPNPAPATPARRGHGFEPGPDGGDSPAWSRKRPAYQPPPVPAPGQQPSQPAGQPPGEPVPYAELHAHSS